ncbi:hypothetical protein [Streptomyces sp. NBC_00198]|uniref:hypothetical protein n=1 Tax=Streptomyces sp. NBC_00198 TaxID=2975677 RepID=UPI002258E4FC|nr:hypothetical protein [Streptomyces sp. NBC_00198]MCX5278743.1 hypothetical protein [Streptomyces sp. NBC_00198]
MVRRPVAWVTALVLFAEAIGVALLNWFLGVVVDRQDMSLAGLDSDTMAVSSKIGGLVFGLYFVACAVSALLVGVRDRAPGLVGRVLLISAAVVHALLGAFTVGLVGWGAFVFMMVVLGLIVFTLLAYDRREAGPADAAPPGGGGDGEGLRREDGAAQGAGQGAGQGGTVDLGKDAGDGGHGDSRHGDGGTTVVPPPAPSAS